MMKFYSLLIQYLQIIELPKNFVYNTDTNLWHVRLDHYYNNNIKDFVIEHTKSHNDNYIDSIINFKDFLIEGESYSNINNIIIYLQLRNPSNTISTNYNNNNNIININNNYNINDNNNNYNKNNDNYKNDNINIETKIINQSFEEENEYPSESDNEFLCERKLKYINKKRSHSNNSYDTDEENLNFQKRKIKF